MAEDPASWNEIQKAISEAIHQHHDAQSRGAIGYSLVSRIYYHLVEKGYVVPPVDRDAQRKLALEFLSDMEREFGPIPEEIRAKVAALPLPE